MYVLKVNGVILKNPSNFDPTLRNLASDSSYTSETGVTNIDAVRNNIVDLSVTWNRLSSAELKAICDLISSDDLNKTVFEIEYYAIEKQAYQTGNFYATDRAIKTKIARSITDSYSSLSVKLKEA